MHPNDFPSLRHLNDPNLSQALLTSIDVNLSPHLLTLYECIICIFHYTTEDNVENTN